VVFPPVEVDQLALVTQKDDYYVTASFLAPYKRADLVVAAFNAMPDRRLVVVGEGPQTAQLRKLAGRNVVLTGHLPRSEYMATVGAAKAFVFAGCEDFGIALAEAQACGTPLIAFARGGACDIVRPLGKMDRPTGILFRRQTAAAIQDAVEHFESNPRAISPVACRQNAARFSADRFEREMRNALDRVLAMHDSDSRPGTRDRAMAR
jgi:glycosyltransferase involved in cell wall biosynthesis